MTGTGLLATPAARSALEGLLAEAFEACSARLREAGRIIGGSVQENWMISVDILGGTQPGQHRLVLRTDSSTRLAASRSRAEEFALLRAAFAAEVLVPEPLCCSRDGGILGRPFFVMRSIPGVANGEGLVNEMPEDHKPALAMALGAELAKIHGIVPPRPDLRILGAPPADPAAARIELYRAWLDRFDDPHPVAEWALRWLALRKPAPLPAVLCHGDFRTGNYLVAENRLTAILDWEFAEWGDPHEDIGWFCSKYWRFGALDREAGGIAAREPFYAGYESAGGRQIDPARARYWEVMANLRWLILALQQRDRFLKGGERSLDLALTGRRPAECEYEILRLTGEPERGGA